MRLGSGRAPRVKGRPAMLMKKVAWACAVMALVSAIGASPARAGELRFDVLRQSAWDPYVGFFPSANAANDWSVKAFLGNELQWEMRPGYGFNRGLLSFPTFEDLRASSYRVEYTPTASAQTSTYTLSLDAPQWSTALLPGPRPVLSGSREAGQPLTVTWPVYEGSGSAKLRVRRPTSPFTELYYRWSDYVSGILVTDPLPPGAGVVDLDYVRDMPGALARMELVSGPPTDMALSTDVKFYSWQSAGFIVTPEPTSLAWPAAAAALAVLGRRRVS
jgi:uncharacterized protein (TIGR03382 family)